MAPDLHALATELLDECVAQFAVAGVEPPDRRYVADGPANAIAIDAEQLVVCVGPLVPGPPNEAEVVRQVGAGLTWMTTLFVDCARPAPMVDDTGPPIPADIEASARRIMADAPPLLAAVSAFGRRCARAFNPSLTWIGPEGGYARAVLAFEVRLL